MYMHLIITICLTLIDTDKFSFFLKSKYVGLHRKTLILPILMAGISYQSSIFIQFYMHIYIQYGCNVYMSATYTMYRSDLARSVFCTVCSNKKHVWKVLLRKL